MQVQLKEAHEAIIQEKEAAKIAIAQAPPVIKEVPVVDESKLELLRIQNKELEVKYQTILLANYSLTFQLRRAETVILSQLSLILS